MRRTSGRRLLAVALLFAGLPSCERREPASSAAIAEPARTAGSPLPLRIDEVRRLQAHVDSLSRNDPRRPAVLLQLADALVALASLHRTAAREADSKVDALPLPADRRAGLADAEESYDGPPAEPQALPALREEAVLAPLVPLARAHVVEADQRALEAIARLDELLALSGRGDASRVEVRRARLLDELGQRTQAREGWYRVVRRTNGEPSARAEAYRAFARWYDEQGKSTERDQLLRQAQEAASGTEKR